MSGVIRLLLQTGLAAGMAGGFAVFIYTMVGFPVKYARQCGNSIPFECTQCGAVRTYGCEESISIKRKPRNTSFRGVRTYRYPCAACGQKTMQKPMKKAFTAEQQQILRKKIIRGILIGLLFEIAGIVCGALYDNL
ncbi:MAG: hypothetical protein LBT26_05660 [Clostridiales Family XIII bacterium]|jgi:hypothetical protein|nr:hypothetical protein [Clostridiales Family XIII bacterium]